MKQIATLDFGVSTEFNKPVSNLMLDKLWPTVALVGTSTLLSIIFGLWIGTDRSLEPRPEVRPGLDDVDHHAVLDAGVVARTRALLAVRNRPVGVSADVPDRRSDHARASTRGRCTASSTRPGTSCSRSSRSRLAYLAEFSLIMRSSLLDEMGEDYLTTARAKGLRDVAVRRRHATRNALLPVVTIVSLNLGFVVGGAITIETVFSIPGLGLLTYDALRVPDVPMLQGTFFFFSAAVVIANLVSNLLYGVLDPRVRI